MASKTMVLTSKIAKHIAPKAEKADKAAAAPKAAPKADKAAPKAAAKADTFALHLNKTGRLCIGAAAAERLGDAPFATLQIEGKIVRLVPQKKEVEGALPVRYADPEFMIRPFISATKQFKTLGFDGSSPRAFDAKPYGNGGFEFRY